MIKIKTLAQVKKNNNKGFQNSMDVLQQARKDRITGVSTG